MDNIKHAKKWVEHAKKFDKADYISRFIFMWISFNWLYKESNGETEAEKIKNFYTQHEANFPNLFDSQSPNIS